MEHVADCLDQEGNLFFESAMQKFAPHSKSIAVDESNFADITAARIRKSDDEVQIKPLKSKKIVLQSNTRSESNAAAVPSEKKLPQKSKNSVNRDISELIDQFERLLDEARNQSPLTSNPSVSLPGKSSYSSNSTSPISSYSDRVFEARGIKLKLFEVDPDEEFSAINSSSSLSHFADRSEEIQRENVARSIRR